MNYLDLAIWLVLGASIIIGLYSGFLSTLLNGLGMLISYICAWLFYGSLAEWFWGHTEWVEQLIHYTEGAARIPTLEMARSSISLLSAEQVGQIVDVSQMPEPFARLITENVAGHVLASQGLNTIADYFNNTVVYVSINIIGFVMLFLLLYIAFSIAISATAYVVRFPVIRTMDWLAGGIMGLGRGFVLAMVACSMIPIVLAILPSGIDFIDEILQTSSFAEFFLYKNPILDGIRGVI